MALNDPGLQSLSSIAASEFYDVTITDTNSPIEQGDTLVVDYEVDNTGDKTGSQDITLEIDSVLEDTDAGVRVLANRTGSGTLEWVTASDETAQDYTATVLSADDSATQTVTVEDAASAIPDSAVHQWLFSESTGSTALDNIGDADKTINGANWVSGNWEGGYALEFDGVDDFTETDVSDHVEVGDAGAIAITAESNTDGDDTFYLMAHNAVSADERIQISTIDGVWRFGLGEDFDWEVTTRDVVIGETIRIGLRWDNGSGSVFFNGEQYTTKSYNGTISTTDNPWVVGSNTGEDFHYDGIADNPVIYEQPITETEFSQDYNAQPWS